MQKSDDELLLEAAKEQQNRRAVDRFRFKFPFVSGELSGQHVILGIIVLFLAAPVIAGIYMHNAETDKTAINIDKRLAKLEELQLKQIQSYDAIIYVISLNQIDRDKLQLAKPTKIRELERSN